MNHPTISDRRIEVYVGRPEGLEDEKPDEGMPSLDECYSIDFIERGGESGFHAQTSCLCNLGSSSQAWLMGQSVEEVQAIMSKHAEEH